jgi:hypothetical protein
MVRTVSLLRSSVLFVYSFRTIVQSFRSHSTHQIEKSDIPTLLVKLPAELAVFPGLQVDLTILGPPADVGVGCPVLDGAPEECSAGEAGHGTVVDVLGCWLPAHLQHKIYSSCQLVSLATVAQMHSDATKMTGKCCQAEFAVSQSVLRPVNMLVDSRADKEKSSLLALNIKCLKCIKSFSFGVLGYITDYC